MPPYCSGIAMPGQPTSDSLPHSSSMIPGRIAIELDQHVAAAGAPDQIARRFLDELLSGVE